MCATCGYICMRSWPLLTHTFALFFFRSNIAFLFFLRPAFGCSCLDQPLFLEYSFKFQFLYSKHLGSSSERLFCFVVKQIYRAVVVYTFVNFKSCLHLNSLNRQHKSDFGQRTLPLAEIQLTTQTS